MDLFFLLDRLEQSAFWPQRNRAAVQGDALVASAETASAAHGAVGLSQSHYHVHAFGAGSLYSNGAGTHIGRSEPFGAHGTQVFGPNHQYLGRIVDGGPMGTLEYGANGMLQAQTIHNGNLSMRTEHGIPTETIIHNSVGATTYSKDGRLTSTWQRINSGHYMQTRY